MNPLVLHSALALHAISCPRLILIPHQMMTVSLTLRMGMMTATAFLTPRTTMMIMTAFPTVRTLRVGRVQREPRESEVEVPRDP